jgi:hypothetical protein
MSDKVYDIIYAEIWKLYRRTTGELEVQKNISAIQETSRLIVDKLIVAKLINTQESILTFINKIEAMNEKIKKKRGKK